MRKQSGEVLRFIHRSAHLFVRVKSRLRMCLAGHGKWCRRWPWWVVPPFCATQRLDENALLVRTSHRATVFTP